VEVEVEAQEQEHWRFYCGRLAESFDCFGLIGHLSFEDSADFVEVDQPSWHHWHCWWQQGQVVQGLQLHRLVASSSSSCQTNHNGQAGIMAGEPLPPLAVIVVVVVVVVRDRSLELVDLSHLADLLVFQYCLVAEKFVSGTLREQERLQELVKGLKLTVFEQERMEMGLI
jgi:hypothetical protein